MWMIAQSAPALPPAGEWWTIEFLDNALWQWATLLGILLVTFAVCRIFSFILDRQGRRIEETTRHTMVGLVVRSLGKPSALMIFAGGLFLAGKFMNLKLVLYDAQVEGKPARTLAWLWDVSCRTLVVVAIGWAVFRLVDAVEMLLRRWTSRTHTLLDDQLVPIIRKSLRIFTVIIVVLFVVQNVLGMEIGPLLAGLGLGGLAFALAAQDTLKNLFGSVTIFADRPFQMGDRVCVEGHDGFVEQVGFRSTRIRTLDGHLVTVPNSKVADTPVENIGRRPSIRRVLDVTVTYDTPPEKMRRAVEIIREMLDARNDHFPIELPGRAYFSDFNAASLNIAVYYWFSPPDWWQYLDFTHDFNMELLERFNREEIEFAFPTQTLYVKQGSPIKADVRLAERGRNGPRQ